MVLKGGSSFDDFLWPKLQKMGWKLKIGSRPCDKYFVPPGVDHKKAGVMVRQDFFDSKKQVLMAIRSEPRNFTGKYDSIIAAYDKQVSKPASAPSNDHSAQKRLKSPAQPAKRAQPGSSGKKTRGPQARAQLQDDDLDEGPQDSVVPQASATKQTKRAAKSPNPKVGTKAGKSAAEAPKKPKAPVVKAITEVVGKQTEVTMRCSLCCLTVWYRGGRFNIKFCVRVARARRQRG